VEIDTATLAITRYFPGVGTVDLGLAAHPLTGDLYVANTEARNLVRFENNLRSNFVSNRVARVTVSDGSNAHFTLSIMGVPPGSGARMGIDRNLDGVLDGDVPVPTLRIALDAGHVVISGSTNHTSHRLERADSLLPTLWTPDPAVPAINGSEFAITNSLSSGSLFFRLREP
jgi:DNA-binding beta-propeller fold protein YncE